MIISDGFLVRYQRFYPVSRATHLQICNKVGDFRRFWNKMRRRKVRFENITVKGFLGSEGEEDEREKGSNFGGL